MAATTVSTERPPPADIGGRLAMTMTGAWSCSRGGGLRQGAAAATGTFGSALPPGGGSDLVASWPDRGIAESRAEVVGTAIRRPPDMR
jgi:hypothetical protein